MEPWGARRGLWCPSHFELQRRGLNPPSEPRIHTDVAPCLVAKQPSMVVQHERRLLKGEEALALQGFPPAPAVPLSDAVVRRLAGNAMNVHVLRHLLAQVLRSLGY